MSAPPRAITARWAVPLAAALLFAAAAAGYLLGFVPQRLRTAERMVGQALALRAEVRASAVRQWLADGNQDAAYWASTAAVVELVRGPVVAGRLAQGRSLLLSFVRSQHLRRAFVYDQRRRMVLATDTTANAPAEDTAAIRAALGDRRPRVSFHRHADGAPAVAFYAVVGDPTHGAAPLGVVVLEADPRQGLFTLVGPRIANLPTGEAFLVERRGDTIAVISPRLGDAAPLDTVHRPPPAPGAPAVALGDRPTRARSVDSRGVPVLTASEPLPEVGWGLVVTVEAAAALAAVKRDLVVNALQWGLALLATFGAVVAWWWGQRRSAEARLAHSLARNALLLDQANDAILFADLDGRIREANQRADALYGYGPGGLVGRRLVDLVAEDQRDGFGTHLAALESDGRHVGESVHVHASGARIPVESSGRRVAVEGRVEIVALVRDIAERKATEGRILRLNRALRTLRAIDEMILREQDPSRLRQEACRILVEQGAVAIAWIGVPEPDGRVRTVAWAPAPAEAITTVRLRWDDTLEGRGPTGTAIREDRSAVVRDAATDERTASWREMAARYGVRSMASVPIRRSATEREALAVQALEPDAFDGDMLGLLEELAGDLGYALQALADRDARQAAERRLSAFFASGLFGTAVGGASGSIQDANDEFLRIVGYTREDLREGRVRWPDLTPPEFGPLDEAALLEAHAQGSCTPYEKQCLRKDGSRAWVLVGYLLLGEQRQESLAFVLDIGERKRAEEIHAEMSRERSAVIQRLRLQVERLPIALILESPTRIVLDWNPAAERMFGYTRDEVLGRPSAELITLDETPAVAGAVVAEAAGSNATVYTVRDVRVRDGRSITCGWHTTALRDGSGTLTGILWMAEDVSDRIRASEAVRRSEESLRVLNAELERRVAERTARLELANRELESFAASISDHLRGPLRAIGGYAQILLEEHAGRLEGEARRHLDLVHANTERMAAMITDLVKFSRVGRQEMVAARIDMAALVRSVWFEITTADQRERVTLRVAELPPAVGDGPLLRQVWAELLSNAVKFTSPKPHRTIDVDARARPGRTVYLVRDNGVGFEPARADRLFTVFQRLHPTSAFEGTGVGLALAQRIVHRHGGSLWAEAVVGEGATFSFDLPAAREAGTA